MQRQSAVEAMAKVPGCKRRQPFTRAHFDPENASITARRSDDILTFLKTLVLLRKRYGKEAEHD